MQTYSKGRKSSDTDTISQPVIVSRVQLQATGNVFEIKRPVT